MPCEPKKRRDLFRLDPVGWALVKQIIEDHRAKEKSFFFSTHIATDVAGQGITLIDLKKKDPELFYLIIIKGCRC